MEKLISVIMPAHNAEMYIDAAIRSVLSQDYQNWEMIIIDDASTDSTASVISTYCSIDSRIRCITFSQNQGVATARNAGIAEAKGDYIAFLDSDDLWSSEKLRTQLDAIGKADFSYTAYAVMNAEGTVLYYYSVPERISLEMLLKENWIGCSTVLVKSSVIKSYSFCSDVAHEDYLLWLALLKDGCSAIGCGQPLTHWRFVRGTRSYGKLRSARGRLRVYEMLGIPFCKRVQCFLHYCIRGILKYYHILRRDDYHG